MTWVAPDIASASRSAKKYWNVAYPAAKTMMNAVIHQLLPASHPASRPIAANRRMNAPRMTQVLRLLRAMALYITCSRDLDTAPALLLDIEPQPPQNCTRGGSEMAAPSTTSKNSRSVKPRLRANMLFGNTLIFVFSSRTPPL